MHNEDAKRFRDLMNGICGMKGRPLLDAMGMKLWWSALTRWSYEDVEEAFEAHLADRDRGRHMPMPADIIEILAGPVQPDGWLEPDEAWACVARDEADTAVWCQEIADAWFDVCHLMPNETQTRMAFRDAYTRRLKQARAQGLRPKWTVSLGHDPVCRESALRRAVRDGRISLDHANAMLPAPIAPDHVRLPAPAVADTKRLEGPDSLPADDEMPSAAARDAYLQAIRKVLHGKILAGDEERRPTAPTDVQRDLMAQRAARRKPQ